MTRSVRAVFAVALLWLSLGSSCAFAVRPDEILADPKLEAEARNISAELRCLVCQNQSIDDSDAPLARDLRVLVRERLKAGDDRAGVIDFVVARYGEFVLLRPRFTARTVLLWIAPLLLLAGGIYLAWRQFGGRHPEEIATPAPLTDEEQAKLKQVLAADSSPRQAPL
jgi:cytochrome c-type biogenesis protein CcmH